MSLGEAGVQVSALCLGCMFFGTRVDEATAMRLLDRYALTLELSAQQLATLDAAAA